ncbi:MAG TPA: Ig-like domain-containing protein, partial [Planctomycetota bacterium]|nr:Ig-like domain-containing protein [Planctomycetota bacterium]
MNSPHRRTFRRSELQRPETEPPKGGTTNHQRTFRLSALLCACVSFAAFSAEMTVTKAGSPNAVPPGGTINYTVTINNPDTVNKTNVVLSDTLDGNVALTGSISASPVALDDSYTCTGNVSITIPANIGVLTNDYLGMNPTATITAFDATSANGGSVAVTTSGVNAGAFTYNPPRGFTGADTFTYTLNNSAGSSIGTVTINVTNMIWFIDNTQVAAGDGRFKSPYNTLAAFAAVNGVVAPPALNPNAGDAIFIYAGSGSYTGGVTLLSTQRLIGQGVALNAASLGFTPSANSDTLPGATSNPTIVNATAGGNGVTLNTNNVLNGFNIGNSAGSALAGTSFGTLTVNNVAINTNGQALNLATGAFASTSVFTSITSTGGTNNISLSAVTGTVSFGGGTLSGSTGANYLSTGGTLTAGYIGSISRSAAPRMIDIENATGGTTTFSGPLTQSANAGTTECILLNNNTGATIDFTGGVTLTSSSSAPAFSVTGGGSSVIVTGTASTIAASGTGAALNVVNSLIGANNLNFKSISSSGGTASGIVLNNTGNSGGLIVAGDGNNTNNSSGGTIQNCTGNGISLTSTQGVSLTSMTIQNIGKSGVSGTGVNNFSFTAGTINTVGTAGGTGVLYSNIAFNSNSSGNNQNGSNITGTLSVTNSTLSNALYGGIDVECGSGTLSNVTITGNTITSSTSVASSLGTGINFVGVGAGTAFSITKATVSGNTVTNFPSAAGIQFNFTGTGAVCGTPGSGTNVVTITSNNVNGQSAATGFGTSAIITALFAGAQGNFNVSSNPSVKFSAGHTVLNGVNGSSTATVVHDSNVIVSNNTFSSNAISGGNGVVNNNSDTPNCTWKITNNNVSQSNGPGILAVSRNATGTLNLKLTGNTAGAPTAGVNNGIRVDSGNTSSANETVCATISGNTATGSGGDQGIGVRKQGTVATTNTFGITGISPSPAPAATVQTYLANQNPASAGGVLVLNGDNFVVCSSAPPLMLASGGVAATSDCGCGARAAAQKDAETHKRGDAETVMTAVPVREALAREAEALVEPRPMNEPRPQGSGQNGGKSAAAPTGVVTKDLTQEQLNATVAAAIQRWSRTGLSTAQIALLKEIRFEVKEMPGWYLGSASNGKATLSRTDRKVTLSSTAAGYGWYIGNDPLSNVEFADTRTSTRLFADPQALPAGKLDLLTTVMHEMGHQLGLEDAYKAGERDSLMFGYLTLGERRLPVKDQAKGVEPHLLTPGSGFLFTPVNIGTLPPGKQVVVTFSVVVASPTSATSVSNTATATADGPLSIPSNTVTTTILQPDLQIVKSHVGNFTQGDTNKTFTIAVSNVGQAATNGTVTVSDTLPAGLTPTAADNGTVNGWAVSFVNQTITATRSDVLGASPAAYPNLIITVNVAATAATSLSNTATVSGGNEINAANDTSTDTVTVVQVPFSITSTQGTPQSATVNTAFATVLKAVVKDAGGVVIPNASVTFTAPASGASGKFANNTNTTTVTTDASGIATATAFTANTTAGGPYNVTAAVGALAPINFALTNTPGLPSTITTTAGTPQSATVNTAFVTTLVAVVKDSFANVVPGVSVTFTAPAGGASGKFVNTTNTTAVTTDSNGLATATAFTANTIAGSYNVTAAASGGTNPSTNFALTNNPGAAASIAANAGTPQSTTVNTPFANPLQAIVKDSFSNPVPGVSVTFTAPASGTSGTFSNSTITITGTTNASGILSETFTANTAAGSYTVTATTAGVGTPASFSLTNTPGAATHFSVTAPGSANANIAFNFTVTALDQFNNTVSGYAGTVHFTSTDGSASLPANSTLTNGTGTFSATLKTAGNQTITATDTVTSSITGTSGTISVIAVTHFSVTAPGSTPAGSAINVTVTALDLNNATVTAYAGSVHLTSSDGQAVLPANSTLTNGTGTFSVTLKTAGNQTVSVNDVGQPSITGTSSAISVSPLATNHFTVSAPANVTAGIPFTFTVLPFDQFNNPTLPSYTGTVHFTSSDGAAVLPANSTLGPPFNATLKTAGTQTITATDTVTSSITGTSNSIAVSAAAATHFTVSAPSGATAGSAFNYTVTALDQFNNTATGYGGTVHFTSSDGLATLPANSTLSNGTGTFSATLKIAGNQTITATDTVTGTITGTSNTIAVSAAAATHFTVSAPSSATAGTAFNFTVTAQDQFNNTATGYAGTVHFTSSDGQAVLPANTTLSNGTGTFSATLKTAGSQTLTATDTVTNTITGLSNAIAVSAAAATHFTVSAPGSATAGTAFNFTVTALDPFNNTATAYAGTIHFTSSDGSAVLPANSTLTNGTGTFSATMRTAGSQTITATDTVTGSITGTSNTIAVSAAAATHFTVSAPGSTTSGAPFSITVTALDQFNNIAKSYLGTVHFTKTDSGAASSVPANYTFVGGDNGVHTFTNGVTLVTVGNQTVTATDTVTGTITGGTNVQVNPAGATHFTVSAPGSATAGTAFNYTVTALDQFGNTATGYAGTVHFTSTDGQAVLNANTTLTNGTGSFSATLKSAGSRTITATDTVTSSITGTSNSIAVNAAAATHFTVSAPGSTTAGSAFSVTVTALDPFNNIATTYTGTVHFTKSDNGAASAVPADYTFVAGDNGVHIFSNAVTLVTAGTQTVTATDTVSSSITGTSNNIAVNAAAATHFLVSAPSTTTALAPFSVTVTALDQFGNTAKSYAGTVHFTKSDSGAGSAVPANYTFVAGDNGVHTFSNGVTFVTAGSQTVTATDTVTSSITGTANVTVNPAAATHFSVSAPGSATAGTAFSVTVTALDAANNTATGYSGMAHFTSSDASAVLPADSTLTNGAGTFSATLKTAGNQTITATDTVTVSITGTSNTIAVSPAAATHYAVSAPSSATAGTAFNVTVTAQDQFNNTATAYSGTVHFTSSDAQAVLPANSTLTNGAGTFSSTLKTSGAQTITATDTASVSITGTSGTITVSPIAATHFLVTAPANINEGDTFNFTVTAQDPFNNTDPTYAGTVHFTSSDAKATLPANSTLTSGVGSFSATIKKTGSQTLTATDTAKATINGTATIQVANVAPTVTIGNLPTLPETGTPITLSATVVDPGIDTDVVTLAWTVTRSGSTFATGSGASFTFTPDIEGSYVVTVVATDSDNAQGTATVTIAVDTSVKFLSGPSYTPDPAVVNVAATFSVTMKPPDAIVTWDFGDGTPTATGQTVTHIYTVAGNYTATVTGQN